MTIDPLLKAAARFSLDYYPSASSDYSIRHVPEGDARDFGIHESRGSFESGKYRRSETFEVYRGDRSVFSRLENPIHVKIALNAADLYQRFLFEIEINVADERIEIDQDESNAVIAVSNRYVDLFSQDVIEIKTLRNFMRRVSNIAYPEIGYVYVFGEDGGACKIGCTTDPNQRLKTLATGMPFKPNYRRVMLCRQMNRTETTLHKFYKKLGYHIHLEWYRISAEDQDFFRTLDQVDDVSSLMEVLKNLDRIDPNRSADVAQDASAIKLVKNLYGEVAELKIAVEELRSMITGDMKARSK